MILLDLSHTSHTHARTGVQRVSRSLLHGLSKTEAVRPITFDPFQQTWRQLETWEQKNLESTVAASKRSSRWPWPARWRGRWKKIIGTPAEAFDSASALVVPEIFSAQVGRAFPRLFTRVQGPRVAIFHDAIALKYPELTPQKTVARFAGYLLELSRFDGVAAVSDDSLQSLSAYWKWCGVTSPPPIRKISLGVAPAMPTIASSASQTLPVVLSVGSLEGRKNHLELLEACEQLWQKQVRFELRLIGMAHRETGRLALRRIEELQNAGRPLRYDGPVEDGELEKAYSECAFTVYPSLMEGFGLPVLESLRHARACICSHQGALGEASAGGGCLTVSSVTRHELAAAISRLLESPELREQLAQQGAARKFRSWDDYARDLFEWLEELRRR